jgi:hypothetical protein
MSSMLAIAGEAILAAINAAGIAMPMTAYRTWRPTLEGMDRRLRVMVVPRSYDRQMASRAALTRDLSVTVIIARHLEAIEPADILAEIDELDALVEQIESHLWSVRTFGPTAMTKAERADAAAFEQLDDTRQFIAGLTLTLKVGESMPTTGGTV